MNECKHCKTKTEDKNLISIGFYMDENNTIYEHKPFFYVKYVLIRRQKMKCCKKEMILDSYGGFYWCKECHKTMDEVQE